MLLDPANVGRSTATAPAAGRASKSKSRGPVKGNAPSSILPPKEILAKGGKRAATTEDAQRESSKRGRRDEDAAHSEAKSSKSLSQITRGFGSGYNPTLRRSLVHRAPRGVKYNELVINNSVEDFLAAKAALFEEFATKVKLLQTHLSSLNELICITICDWTHDIL